MKIIDFLKNKKVIISIILLVLFISILVLNIYTPLIVDDYAYSFGLNGKLSSIKDIIEYQKWHYLNWSGRSIAHTIAQFFLMNNKMIFNISNTIVFISLVFIISLLSDKKLKFDITYFCLVFLGLWFFVPAYGQSFLWLTGSSNYLWTTTILLLFLLLFMKIDSNKKQNTWKIIGISLLGFLAGWTNENSAAGLIAMLLVIIFMNYQDKKQINKTQIIGLISTIISFLIMILSPGNKIRNSGLIDKAFFLFKWLRRSIYISQELISYFIIPITIIIVIISIYIYKKQKLDKRLYIFLVGIIASTYSMILSPEFPARSWTIVAIYLIIIIGLLIKDFNIKTKIKSFIITDLLIILGLVYFGEYVLVFKQSSIYYNIWEDRKIEIEYGKNNGIMDFEFEDYKVPYKQCASYGLHDMFEGKEDYNNKLYAKYFGVDSICMKELRCFK